MPPADDPPDGAASPPPAPSAAAPDAAAGAGAYRSARPWISRTMSRTVEVEGGASLAFSSSSVPISSQIPSARAASSRTFPSIRPDAAVRASFSMSSKAGVPASIRARRCSGGRPGSFSEAL